MDSHAKAETNAAACCVAAEAAKAADKGSCSSTGALA